MHRETIDTCLERAILGLVLGLIAFGTLAFGGVRPLDGAILAWMVLGALGLWLARLWIAPKFRFLWPPVCWAILPFIGFAIWRWQTADVEFPARQEVIQAVLCALLFLIVINNLYGQESVRVFTLSLIFLGTVVAMHGIFQWLRHSETVWGLLRPQAYFERASGSFICPNHLAGFLEMILPLALAVAVMGRLAPAPRVCVLYGALVMMVGLGATRSRGGWIAAVAGLGLLVLCLLRTRGGRWAALGLVIVVLGTGQWLYSRSVEHRITGAQYSGNNKEIRFRLWTAAWQMWRQHPWTGVGPDHFDLRYRQYREAVNTAQGRPGRVHNDYLNTLADYGIVGLALALLPLGVAVWTVLRCWPHVQRSGSEFGEKKSNRAAIVLGASAGLLALLVHSFFDFNLHIPSNAFLFAALLAVVMSHTRFATERHWFTARLPLKLIGSAALAGVLFLLLPMTLTRTREALVLRLAERAADGSAEKIARLEKAFALQPKNFETAYALGEQLRGLAWLGGDNYQERARQALVWFQRAFALNRWDQASNLGAGMCLDWLGRRDEAEPYFTRALEIDPNHWQARTMMGWHQFQKENYADAAEWFKKSLPLNWEENPMAHIYLNLCEKYLREDAAGIKRL